MSFSQEGVDNIAFFWCDTDADVNNIPITESLKTGSKAFVVDNGNLYMFKSDTQEWKLQE